MKKNMRVYAITISAFVVLLLAFAAYKMLSSSSTEKEAFNEEGSNVMGSTRSSNPDIKVMLFYATWCPHCESYLATGTFDKFDRSIRSNDMVTGSVECTKYDYDKNQALGDRYGISSFPTIIAVDQNEKVYRFQGDRQNSQHLTKFVAAAIQGKTLTAKDYA